MLQRVWNKLGHGHPQVESTLRSTLSFGPNECFASLRAYVDVSKCCAHKLMPASQHWNRQSKKRITSATVDDADPCGSCQLSFPPVSIQISMIRILATFDENRLQVQLVLRGAVTTWLKHEWVGSFSSSNCKTETHVTWRFHCLSKKKRIVFDTGYFLPLVHPR